MHAQSVRDERVPGQSQGDDDARRDREAERAPEEPRDVARRVGHEREEERGDADGEAVGDGELTRQERELEDECAEDDRQERRIDRLVQEQHRNAFDVRDDLAPLGDDIRQVRELPVQQHEPCDGLGGRRSRVHRDPDVGRFDGEGVVDAVAGHRDGVPVALQRRDHALLLLGGDASEHRVPVEHVGEFGIIVGKPSGIEPFGDVETDLARDGCDGARVVARDDADADLLAPEVREGLCGVGAHLLPEREHDDGLETLREPLGIDIGLGEHRVGMTEDQRASAGLGQRGHGATELRGRRRRRIAEHHLRRPP